MILFRNTMKITERHLQSFKQVIAEKRMRDMRSTRTPCIAGFARSRYPGYDAA